MGQWLQIVWFEQAMNDVADATNFDTLAIFWAFFITFDFPPTTFRAVKPEH